MVKGDLGFEELAIDIPDIENGSIDEKKIELNIEDYRNTVCFYKKKIFLGTFDDKLSKYSRFYEITFDENENDSLTMKIPISEVKK